MDIWKPEIGSILYFGGPLGVRRGPEKRPRAVDAVPGPGKSCAAAVCDAKKHASISVNVG
jgi:hypothetical protein